MILRISVFFLHGYSLYSNAATSNQYIMFVTRVAFVNVEKLLNLERIFGIH